MTTAVSRRGVIRGVVAATGLGGLSACTGGLPGSSATATPPARADSASDQAPDVALAATALAEQRDVLDLVEGAIAAHPGLASVLAGAREGHRAHVRLLAGAVASSPPPATPTRRTTDLPAAPRPALSALAAAEQALATSARGHAVAARSGAFARVLASAAAAASQQAVHLTEAARGRR